MVTTVAEAQEAQAASATPPVEATATNHVVIILPHAPTVAAPVPAPIALPPVTPPHATGRLGLPQDFLNDNRIQVKDGAVFASPYLVMNRRELNPANEARLREKLRLTGSLNSPSFFEFPNRGRIANYFGMLIPTTLQSQNTLLMQQIQKFNTQVDSGVDTRIDGNVTNFQNPFAAILHDTLNQSPNDPVAIEMRQNGIALYVLMNEKLQQQGYHDKLTSYVEHLGSPDQVLQDLSVRVGATPKQVREAAAKGGIDAVGGVLGLSPEFIADAKEIAAYAVAHQNSANALENWMLGERQLRGKQATLQQKLEIGLEAQITESIPRFRDAIQKDYTPPLPVQAQEKQVAQKVMLLEPIQRELMYALGYEICYTPQTFADQIAGGKNVWGMNYHVANHEDDFRSTNRIFFSSHGNDLADEDGTFVHECAHVLFPRFFKPESAQAIAQLAASDANRYTKITQVMQDRFPEVQTLHHAYLAGDAAEKAAVIATANERFASYGIAIGDLFPATRDVGQLKYLAAHASQVLNVEGAFYGDKPGYTAPQTRFREMISRFARIRQVAYASEPELVKAVAPGFTAIWEQYYIPHLEQTLSELQAYKNKTAVVAPIAKPIADDQKRLHDLQNLMTTRFDEFEQLVNAYQAGNDQQKATLAASMNNHFKNAEGMPLIDGMMLGYIPDAKAFRAQVEQANQLLTLQGRPEGAQGLNEVLANVEQLKQGEYHDQPQLIHYLAPGLDDAVEKRALESTKIDVPPVTNPPTMPTTPPNPGTALPLNHVNAPSVMANGVMANSPAIALNF